VRKLVVDLSVWIDMYHGGIIENFLHLGADILVSDAQLLENEEEKGLCLGSLLSHFTVESYSASEMTAALKLVRSHGRLKPEDILAYLLARRAGAILVTGDRRLRSLAESYGVECHGTIWVLDEMVAAGCITKAQACESLGLLMRENARLPSDEVEKRFEDWCPKD